jgi:hypothetical protein
MEAGGLMMGVSVVPLNGNFAEIMTLNDGYYMVEAKDNPQYSLATIHFQEGSVPENGVNGCQVEDILAVCIHRLNSFQSGPCPHPTNYRALSHIYAALEALSERTAERVASGKEGSMEP